MEKALYQMQYIIIIMIKRKIVVLGLGVDLMDRMMTMQMISLHPVDVFLISNRPTAAGGRCIPVIRRTVGPVNRVILKLTIPFHVQHTPINQANPKMNQVTAKIQITRAAIRWDPINAKMTNILRQVSTDDGQIRIWTSSI